jgi:SOS-response transcriptional repressor LexA
VPGAYQLLALGRALDISCWEDEAPEGEIPLNGEGLALLSGFRGWLESQPRYRSRLRPPAALKEMNVSLLPASAGLGEALDNNAFERMSFPAASVPAGASFAVRVHGDSMEPVLHDGQYAWVRETASLNPGDVGLFIVDGDGYIKVYGEQAPAPEEREAFTDSAGILHPQPVLLSCNEQYAPKVISSESGFRIVGRVLNV